MNLLVETKGLRLAYSNQWAFENVNLRVPQRSVTAIIGPSGCGKSSFLMCINRMTDFIDNCRVEGELLVDGQSIYSDETNIAQLRKDIGMIFQKPNPFPISIYKNLDLPLKYHGVSKAQRKILIEKTLKEVGLWGEVKDRLKQSALSLSGGQQQRLCIARAICLEPKLLLMDEPCSALDPMSSAVVEDLIDQLKEKYTVIVVTHNLGQARRVSDQTAFFWANEGRGLLVEAGPTQQLFQSPRTQVCAGYIEGAMG